MRVFRNVFVEKFRGDQNYVVTYEYLRYIVYVFMYTREFEANTIRTEQINSGR